MRLGLNLGLTGRGGGVVSPLALYAVAGFTPPLVADFENDLYAYDSTVTTFADMFTFARTGTATYIDSSGAIQSAATGVARTAHHVWNGSSWVRAGMLLESVARTNLLLNSATLSTQSVTVTAAAHTLSFTGTGTITLSGASTAGPLVGAGTGENNRVSLTFTPSAGSLTLTVSGTVTNAQLEAGAFRSSYIPTTGSAATRNAETLSIAAAKLPYSASAMSFHTSGRVSYASNGTEVARLFSWVSGSDSIFVRVTTAASATGQINFFHNVASSFHSMASAVNYIAPGVDVAYNVAGRWTDDLVNGAVSGTTLTASTAPTAMPNVAAGNLSLGINSYMGIVGYFRAWDADLGDGGLADATVPFG